MTIRNTKRLIAFMIALMVFIEGINVFITLRRTGHGSDYFELLMPLFLVVMFAGTWRRLSRLEAERGPAYVQPTPPYARKLLMGLGLLAVILGGVLGYLIVSRR